MKKRIDECSCGCGGASGGCQDKNSKNYMFFQNLKTLHHSVGELLKMNPSELDALLSDGHAWAVDHITTSADDVEEVYHFVTSALGHKDLDTSDAYNSQRPQFVPVTFNNHSEMKNFVREIIRKVKDGYRLYSKKKHAGKRRNMGTFSSLTAAKEHEKDINYFKHRA